MVEAGAFRAILDAEMKGNDKPVVIVGDLNDATLSVSTELLSGSPGYRFFAKSTAGLKSDTGLYTVEKLQQLFNAIDPSSFRERDVDPRAREFIVDWSRYLPSGAPLALVVHLV